MATAPRDENRVPTLLGVSSIDFTTPTTVAVNPATGALIIDASSITPVLDAIYLRLDTANDPVTGLLRISNSLRVSGYLRVNSTSAPTNTTAGDITATRLSLNDDSTTFAEGTGSFLKIQAASVATSGASIPLLMVNTIANPSTSSSDFRNVFSSNRVNTTQTISGATTAMYLENRPLVNATVTTEYGLRVTAHQIVTAAGALGTVTNIVGADITPITDSSTGVAGTVTNIIGVRIFNATKNASSTWTATRDTGIIVEDRTRATNNTNLLIGQSASAAGNWSIYNASANDNYFLGKLGIGTTPVAYAYLYVSTTIGDNAQAENYAVDIFPTYKPTNDITKNFYGQILDFVLDDSLATGNLTGIYTGGRFRVTNNSSTRTATLVVGGQFAVINNGTASVYGNITTAYSGRFTATINGGTVTSYHGGLVELPTGAGTITSASGFTIANQTKGGTNNTNLLVGTTTIPTGTFSIYNSSTNLNVHGGRSFFGGTTSATALIHLAAGTATTSTAPLKFTLPGVLLTAAEAGAMETTAEILYFTSTTGPTRKAVNLSVTGRVTAQTAAVASVATYTVGAADASFRVSANVLVSTATLHNFTVTCTYTDESNASRVLTLNFSQLTGAFVTAITNVTGAGVYEGVPLHIRCKASTTITIATTGTFTTVTYNAEGTITQVA